MGILNKFFSYEYITKEHLAGFDKYKYSCVDNSPFSNYVMHPFWNRVVNFFPKWLAPNILTFTGFLCLIVNFIFFSIYDYSFYGYCFDRQDCSAESQPNLTTRASLFQESINSHATSNVPADVCSCIPRWLWLLISVCQFLSHHLDGMDGKQARRTNSSSPLGELFDHGLDSWATLFLPLALFSIFGRCGLYGATVFQMYGILWLILISFIVSHWEKYNTGILFLPWSYDLSQVGMTVLFFMTYLFGQEVWYFNVGDFTSTQIIETLIYVFALGLSIPFSVYNMFMAHKNKTFKQNSLYESIRPLLSTLYLFVVQLVWIKYSKNNIFELEPRMFFWLTGTLFSNIACRLIVAQMTSTRCDVFNVGLVPLTFIVSLFSFVKFERQMEVFALYFLVVLITLQHVHYGICMVRQICKHLKIYCFIITSRPNNKAK